MNNLIIGLGNTGTNIVKAIAGSPILTNIDLYAIDSVASSVDLSMIDKITVIPIISDEKSGSGRNRDRGRAMFEFHESQNAFAEMYAKSEEAKSPILVITSAAGGTGSGATVPLCKTLIEKGLHVIPIIICPNKKDPAAFHLNANDLFIELAEVGVETYSVFENRCGDADYTPVNQEVVNLIEVILGKRYDKTDLDSIDDSDLDVTLNMPGRLLVVQAEAASINELQKELTRKVFAGFQPAWKTEDVGASTLITAFALKSMYAEQDFSFVFNGIRERLDPPSSPTTAIYDEFRNIKKEQNASTSSASLIIAGLPRTEIKEIENNYKEATGLGDGIKKSTRPGFLNKKRASVITDTKTGGNSQDVLKKFKWGK